MNWLLGTCYWLLVKERGGGEFKKSAEQFICEELLRKHLADVLIDN